jgi:hypothetical protein
MQDAVGTPSDAVDLYGTQPEVVTLFILSLLYHGVRNMCRILRLVNGC